MLIVASFLSSSILNTFIFFPHFDVRLHSLGVVVRVEKRGCGMCVMGELADFLNDQIQAEST
jgi:hypothetical protein